MVKSFLKCSQGAECRCGHVCDAAILVYCYRRNCIVVAICACRVGSKYFHTEVGIGCVEYDSVACSENFLVCKVACCCFRFIQQEWLGIYLSICNFVIHITLGCYRVVRVGIDCGCRCDLTGHIQIAVDFQRIAFVGRRCNNDCVGAGADCKTFVGYQIISNNRAVGNDVAVSDKSNCAGCCICIVNNYCRIFVIVSHRV